MKQKDTDHLDLGLSLLLERADSTCNTTNSSQIEKLDRDANFVNLERLWKQPDYQAIVSATENKDSLQLSTEERSIDRLWWVRAQIKLEKLPTTLIWAASEATLSFENIQTLPKQDYVTELVENVCSELSNALVQIDKHSIAINLLELANILSPGKYTNQILELVTKEVDRLDQAQVPFFEQAQHSKYHEKLHKLHKTLAPALNIHDKTAETLVANELTITHKTTPNRSFLLLLLLMLLIATLLLFYEYRSKTEPDFTELLSSKEVINNIEPPTESVISLKTALPEPKLKNPATQTPLVEILDNLVTETTQQQNKNDSSPNLNDKKKNPSSITAKSLDFSTPTEPTRITKLINDFDAGYETDEFVSEAKSFNNGDPVEVAKGESPGDYIVNGYENLPGTDVTVNPSRSDSNKGRFYLVMKPTTVYASPSVRAKQLGAVSRGQNVEVVGSIGAWRRILSERGQSGYILADSLSGL